MDWRHLPPLSALRAFSAFASTNSLDQAGASIGVTHAAISQQIRTLEGHLGLRLVDRTGRRLVMTADGQRLASALAEGFGMIAGTIALLTRAESARPLRVTAAPAFAASWLLPRLSDFTARHPGIDLTIDPSPALREFGVNADVGFRFGAGDWPGVDAHLILYSPLVVVAAPAMVPPGRPCAIRDLTDLPWLQELGTREVEVFFARQGLEHSRTAGVVSLPGNLMIDAARNAQGIAIIARSFVETDVAAGRLRILHEDTESEGYFLVTSIGAQRPAVRKFCRWAQQQAGAL